MATDKGRRTQTFGHIIRQRRTELGLTQEELAERVGESVRQSDISRMERDYISLPRRERLEALANALDVTPGYLLMHSGWAANVEPIHVDTPEADGNPPGTSPDSDARNAMETSKPAGSNRIRTRRVRSRNSTRLHRASQDVLAANRELTRAIEALTAVNQPGRNGSTDASGNGKPHAEELDELNKELRGIIEQLNVRNDDLEARSLELQNAVLSSENALFQLSAVMNAVGDVVIVVDQRQQIVLHSHSFREILGHDNDEVLFLDLQGHPLEGDRSPLARVARGESFAACVQVEMRHGELQVYEAVGRPSGVVNGQRLGVLTLRVSPESFPSHPSARISR